MPNRLEIAISMNAGSLSRSTSHMDDKADLNDGGRHGHGSKIKI